MLREHEADIADADRKALGHLSLADQRQHIAHCFAPHFGGDDGSDAFVSDDFGAVFAHRQIDQHTCPSGRAPIRADLELPHGLIVDADGLGGGRD